MASVQSIRVTPKRQECEQKQKLSTASGSDRKRTCIRSDSEQKSNTRRKYNQKTILHYDQDSTVKSSVQGHEQDFPVEEENLSVIDQQLSVASSSIPIRERFCHLLPGYLGANYTLDQRRIMQAQGKLDDLVEFMRNRGKDKRLSISSIRQSMKSNNQVFELDHLKQILFLKNDFYEIQEKRDEKGRIIDILISLPEGADVEERKKEFRQEMFNYLTKIEGFADQNKTKIPCYSFPFRLKDDEAKKKSYIENIQKSNFINMMKKNVEGKLNHFEAFKAGNTTNFQSLLMQKIKQNEQRVKKQQEKEKEQNFGSKELLLVFDEIIKVFTKREKSSMFKSSIIQDLDKSLNLKEHTICRIFDLLSQKYSKFFKVIEHKSGQIYQIQKKLYNEIRLQIEKEQSPIL